MPSEQQSASAKARHRRAVAVLLVAVALIAAAVTIPLRWWPLEGVLASLVFALLSLARVPVAYLVRRLALFLPMVLLISLSLPAAQGFASGWELSAVILLRSTVAFLPALWLINVLPFPELLRTLKRLRTPTLLIAILAFMYRYAFLLWEELERMRTARAARSFGRGGLWFRWKTTAQAIGMLLLRSIDRAERVHGAMCARGWDGTMRSLD